MSGSAPIAIVSPLAAELAGVLGRTRERRRAHLPRRQPGARGTRGWRAPAAPRGPRVILGRLAGEAVALMATGDGPAAAAAGLEALLLAMRPRRLLVLGVAGGLTSGLAEGALVAAGRIVAGDGSAAPREPDACWLARALACGCVDGVAVCADRIAADPRGRRAIREQALGREERATGTGAGAGAAPAGGTPGGSDVSAAVATVDVESVVYAGLAAAWALPYLVVRAVLDPVDEELPIDFEACRDRGGRVRNGRVVLRALARPASLRQLWRLRTRVGAAAARLGALAEQLVAAPPPAAAASEGRSEAGCQAGLDGNDAAMAAMTERNATAGGDRAGNAAAMAAGARR